MIKLINIAPVPMKHGHLDLSLEMAPGCPLGLVGANGVGKSTLIQYFKVHQDQLFPGLLSVFLDQFPLSPLGPLSLKDLLDLFSDHYRDKLVVANLSDYKLIDDFGFADYLKRPISTLSGGQNQIAKLLALFYVDADIFFLDEPTNNLDASRLQILSRVIREKALSNKYIMLIDHNSQFLGEHAEHFKTIVEIDGLNGQVPHYRIE